MKKNTALALAAWLMLLAFFVTTVTASLREFQNLLSSSAITVLLLDSFLVRGILIRHQDAVL